MAELYDPRLNRFAVNRPIMNMGRTGTTATPIPSGPNGEKILIAGGFNSNKGPLATTEIYDPATNRFRRGPELPNDLVDHTATPIRSGVAAGEVLLFGGLKANYLYDPWHNRFLQAQPTMFQRNGHTATIISSGPYSGVILIAGGQPDSSKRTDEFDPRRGNFRPRPSLNVGRSEHTATVITFGSRSGEILLMGGWPADGHSKSSALSSTELYDPANNTFAAPASTAKLLVARAGHTATVIASGPNAGKILIAGGVRNDRVTLSSTELYDPMTNSFSAGPPLHEPRAHHVAITIESGANAGKILIAGGDSANPHNPIWCGDPVHCGFTPLASTELYDPQTNRFEVGPLMRGAPGDAVAVQLPLPPS